MIIRPNYLNELKQYINMPIVKILAGIRRSGKTTILAMLKEELIKSGVNSSNILDRRYTSFEFDEGFSAKNMYDEIIEKITNNDLYYLLLDEVQEIDGWEKAVNSLLEDKNVDIYVTGSNSKLLSSEISTYLTGRYVHIPVYTLSFKEYTSFKKDTNKTINELFYDYLRYGGFPITALNNYSSTVIYQIVSDIYQSVVLNDIISKYNIQNIDMFERVARFVFDNVGKTFSANSIANFFKNENRKISVETIYKYLEGLERAFIVYRCSRYDLQGKSILKTQEKFYVADSSLKYSKLGFNPTSIASMLENIIYFELRRRGYDVYIGKNQTKEIDFIARKRDEVIYIQVCREMPKESEREIANLLEIKDNYPKYVLTLDEYSSGIVKGVEIKNIIDFLLEDY